MTIIYYFIVFLARILDLAILVRVFMTWLPISRDSRFVAIILEITEPVLAPLRRVIPSVAGMDFTPMVGLILIQVAERVLLSALQRVM
jgi:YggT family protein